MIIVKIDCGEYSHKKLKRKIENKCTNCRFVVIDDYPDKSHLWIYFTGTVDLSLIKTCHISINSVVVVIERNITNIFSNIIRLKVMKKYPLNIVDDLYDWFHISYMIRIDNTVPYDTIECDGDEYEWALYYVEGLGCIIHGDDMMMYMKNMFNIETMDGYLIWRIFNY